MRLPTKRQVTLPTGKLVSLSMMNRQVRLPLREQVRLPMRILTGLTMRTRPQTRP